MSLIIALLICMSMVLSLPQASAQGEFEWDVPKETLLAGLMEADIRSVQRIYEMGLLTCREVTEYYLERIATYDEPYNCFITLCEEDALKQADEIDRRIAQGDLSGLLFGIPVVVKDNIDYAGYHTTNGFDKRSNQIADANAIIVDYLRREGAVIIGKSNMSTEAQDARACYSQVAGETKNAYNPYLASGASSGGSAVATALNFAMAGLGTDTNSSLRLPAVLNGCISLRVTWNTLPMDGILALNSRRDVPGVITRTVLDQAIVLDVLSGGETSYADNLDSSVLGDLRLGVIEELVNPWGKEDEEIIATFEAALAELESCGAEIVSVSVPGIDSWNYNSNDSTDYRERKLAQMEEIMEENGISAFLFPSYLSAPQYSGRDENGTYWYALTQPFTNNTGKLSPNLGVPEIAVPIGYHSRGAGIGMEIAARKNEEQLLLNIAYAYTMAYNHRKVPPVGDLYAQWYRGNLTELRGDYYAALGAYRAPAVTTETEVPTTERLTEEPTASIEEPTEPQISPTEESHTQRWVYILIPICAIFILALTVSTVKRRKRNTTPTP